MATDKRHWTEFFSNHEDEAPKRHWTEYCNKQTFFVLFFVKLFVHFAGSFSGSFVPIYC